MERDVEEVHLCRPLPEGTMSKDDFVLGWFADENRVKLAELIDEHEVKSVIEIGSFLGLSAIWFAKNAGHVTCIDKWREDATEENENNLLATLRRHGMPRDFYQVFLDNMVEAGVAQQITPLRGKSVDLAPFVHPADLVYIDGDHGYEGCAADIIAYGGSARKIICGDDYVDRDGFGVIKAVSKFLPNHQHVGPFWWYEI